MSPSPEEEKKQRGDEKEKEERKTKGIRRKKNEKKWKTKPRNRGKSKSQRKQRRYKKRTCTCVYVYVCMYKMYVLVLDLLLSHMSHSLRLLGLLLRPIHLCTYIYIINPYSIGGPMDQYIYIYISFLMSTQETRPIVIFEIVDSSLT